MPQANRVKVWRMSKFSAADTLELPVTERLRLIQDIRDSIAASPETLTLSEEDKRLIDERLEACRQNPQAGSPWPEVRARIAVRRK
jgi:putative addiction module component (TIGR02574 family)